MKRVILNFFKKNFKRLFLWFLYYYFYDILCEQIVLKAIAILRFNVEYF